MNFTSLWNKNIKQNFFIEVSCLLLCLFPAALVAGPLIAELFLIIINLTFLYLILKNKDFKYFKSYLFLFYLTLSNSLRRFQHPSLIETESH